MAVDDVALRSVTEEEYPSFARAIARQFGDELRDEWVPRWRSVHELDRTVAAFDGERIVGTAVVESYRTPVPGGVVGCAGVTAVGVRTTHRRRGLMTALMRWMLDQAVERGEPVAALYASEAPIYGRYGFGPAAPAVNLRLRLTGADFRVPVTASAAVDLVEAEEARERLPKVFDAVWEGRPGLMSRSEAQWDLMLGVDDEKLRDGASPRYHAVLGDRGYALYRITHEHDGGEHSGAVRVGELLAADAETEAALWQFLASVDLTSRIEARRRPPDDPLPHLLANPDLLEIPAGGPLQVCLVDVAAALAARSYATPGALVFQVTDAFVAGQAGRWRLEVDAHGAAVCASTDQSPDLSLDAATLGALYLGGQRWATLGRARRVAEHSAGALRRADALFASDPLPWNAQVF